MRPGGRVMRPHSRNQGGSEEAGNRNRRYETGLGYFVSIEKKRLQGLLRARKEDLAALMTKWEEVDQTLEANR